MSVGGERGVQSAGLGGVDPPDIQARLALHGNAEGAVALIALREREDQVAELAEPRVRTEQLMLFPIEVDREPAQCDRGRRSALRPDDPSRTTRCALSRQILLEDDDAIGAARGGEPRGPPADHAGADHHQVRGFPLPHVSSPSDVGRECIGALR